MIWTVINLSYKQFCLWGCTKGEVYKIKVDTRDELLARILDAALEKKKHTVFARELHSALRLTVGFSNICYKL